MEIIKGILERLGFEPKAYSNYYTIQPLHRQSNSHSVIVDAQTGFWNDMVTTGSGPLYRLVMLTLDCDEKKSRSFLQGSYFAETAAQIEEPKIKQEKTFPESVLSNLLPSYSFYIKRGISKETLQLFEAGVSHAGKLGHRIVFPIRGFDRKIIGLAGRTLFENPDIAKWKLLGRKSLWVYPWKLVEKNIEETSQVVLVESIGDCLKLYESGIKNCLVLFGLSLSKSVTLYLIRLNVSKIIIATNNDFESIENRGLVAAENIREKLEKFFAPNSIEIRLPPKKDFGECNRDEILEWKEGQTIWPKLQ